MPFYSNDLRLIKTNKAINDAFFSLLRDRNFKKITVRNICEQAVISRATFYSHYNDKYDLLKCWLQTIKLSSLKQSGKNELSMENVNCLINEHKTVINNILYDADSETMEILFELVTLLLTKTDEKFIDSMSDDERIVFSNFFAGGIIHYLSWHVKNKFPFDVVNPYFNHIVESLNKARRC